MQPRTRDDTAAGKASLRPRSLTPEITRPHCPLARVHGGYPCRRRELASAVQPWLGQSRRQTYRACRRDGWGSISILSSLYGMRQSAQSTPRSLLGSWVQQSSACTRTRPKIEADPADQVGPRVTSCCTLFSPAQLASRLSAVSIGCCAANRQQGGFPALHSFCGEEDTRLMSLGAFEKTRSQVADGAPWSVPVRIPQSRYQRRVA